MSKKSFARLIRIVTGTFGTARDEVFSLESNLTRFEKFVHFWVLVSRSFVRNRCPIRASALSYTTLLALIPMLAVAMSITSIFLKNKGTDQIREFVEQFVERVVPNQFSDAFSESIPVPVYGPALPPDLGATNGPAPNASPLAPAATPPLAAPVSTNETPSLEAAENLATLKSDARVRAVQKKIADYIHQFIQNTYSGTLGITGVVILFWTAIIMLTRVEETFNDIWGVTRGRNWLSRVVLYWIQ
jgi:membrane protein